MKALNTVLKILAILAAVAGIVYVAVAYGDKILAWATRQLERCRSFTERLSCKWGAKECPVEGLCDDAPSEADFAEE